jgi:hypothetical protein
MKYLLKTGLIIGAIALFTCNLTLNATIANNGINNIAQLNTASLANAETCELNVGQSIGNCLIWMVMGPADYYFSYNTANCESYCDPAGTNCCYALNL